MPRRLLICLLVCAAVCALPAAASAAPQPIPPAAPLAPGTELSGHEALHRAEAILDGRAHADPHELSPLLKQVAISRPHMSRSDKVRARKLLARPTDSSGEPDDDPYGVDARTNHLHAICTAHFCIHWVSTTDDAPPPTDNSGGPGGTPNGIPDYVDETASVFENVYQRENVQLGWRKPKSDGTRGCDPGLTHAECDNKTDVYLKQVGDQDLYGYSVTDDGETGHTMSAYLVVDNDFADPIFEGYTNKYDPLEVTAAHEYNHVLQYNYDVFMNTWMFEASAVWMEDEVYTDVNDYLQYVPGWAQLSQLPLTNELGSNDEYTSKTYGDMVWNVWLSSIYGPGIVERTWEHAYNSRFAHDYAPGAYDLALNEKKSTFFNAFTRFAADTAEWRASNSPFKEGASFPDVSRAHHISVGDPGVEEILKHTGYALVGIAPTAKPRIKAIVNAERGKRTAVALVGRTGSATGGSATVVLKRFTSGGSGTVVLDNPGRFSRLTLALINGDTRLTGSHKQYFSGEWPYEPPATVDARVSSDFTPPRITHRTPAKGRHGVSRSTSVKVRFSERMTGIRSGTVVLRGPGGRKVKAKLKLSGSGRTLSLRPLSKLRSHRRYTVRIGSSVRDAGANPLPAASRTWTFTTRR